MAIGRIDLAEYRHVAYHPVESRSAAGLDDTTIINTLPESPPLLPHCVSPGIAKCGAQTKVPMHVITNVTFDLISTGLCRSRLSTLQKTMRPKRPTRVSNQQRLTLTPPA